MNPREMKNSSDLGMYSFRVLIALVLGAIFVLSACGAPSYSIGVSVSATAALDSAKTDAPTTAPVTRGAPTPTRVKTKNGLPTIVRAELPPEAIRTLALIRRGGPFPYKQDGQVFQNREGVLPKQRRGYYHEYTVETPGSADRGARRIVTGVNDEYYYTANHYASFKLILDP